MVPLEFALLPVGLFPLSYYISKRCGGSLFWHKNTAAENGGDFRRKISRFPQSLVFYQGAIDWANQSRTTSTTLIETIMTSKFAAVKTHHKTHDISERNEVPFSKRKSLWIFLYLWWARIVWKVPSGFFEESLRIHFLRSLNLGALHVWISSVIIGSKIPTKY